MVRRTTAEMGRSTTDGRSPRASSPDRIVLTLPHDARFRPVASLVLGGVGSRLELSYERLDDLQLAVSCLIAAGSGRELTMDAEADERGVSIAVGPLVTGTAADGVLALILDRLVDTVQRMWRDGEEWIEVGLRHVRPVSGGSRLGTTSR